MLAPVTATRHQPAYHYSIDDDYAAAISIFRCHDDAIIATLRCRPDAAAAFAIDAAMLRLPLMILRRLRCCHDTSFHAATLFAAFHYCHCRCHYAAITLSSLLMFQLLPIFRAIAADAAITPLIIAIDTLSFATIRRCRRTHRCFRRQFSPLPLLPLTPCCRRYTIFADTPYATSPHATVSYATLYAAATLLMPPLRYAAADISFRYCRCWLTLPP